MISNQEQADPYVPKINCKINIMYESNSLNDIKELARCTNNKNIYIYFNRQCCMINILNTIGHQVKFHYINEKLHQILNAKYIAMTCINQTRQLTTNKTVYVFFYIPESGAKTL